MAGAEVVSAVERRDGVVTSGLALNDAATTGSSHRAERAVIRGRRHGDVLGTKRGASVEAALEDAERIVEHAKETGSITSVTVSVAFGCPFEGLWIRSACLAIGGGWRRQADELVLADTIGVATPTQVTGLVEGFVRLGKPVGGHFHNTRNTVRERVRRARC